MNKRLFSFKIDNKLYNKLKMISKEKKISMSNIINIALKNYIYYNEELNKLNNFKFQISLSTHNNNIIEKISYFTNEINGEIINNLLKGNQNEK